MSDIPGVGNEKSLPNEGKQIANTPGAGDKEGFYNYRGQITHIPGAEKVAYAMKNFGMDAASRAEVTAKKDYETGMTEQERENMGITNMLLEEFPDAFEKIIDANGNPVYRVGESQTLGIFKEGMEEGELMAKLQKERAKIDKLVGKGLSAGRNRFLQNLCTTNGAVYFSRYGITTGPSSYFDKSDINSFKTNEQSLRSFPNDVLETFFKVLARLDVIGEVAKEVRAKDPRSITNLRALAQAVKNQNEETSGLNNVG
ncbi:TPA: hypothetical protein DEP90_00245 [Patescibacteria group bacterium]|nr:hypothetical protein [Patescibacteria group bacterium]